MSLDVGSFAELWKLYDQTSGHLRPEFVLPVLFSESGFSTAAENAGHYGINQISGDQLTAMGINPQDYKTWPASRQLQRVAGPFFANQDRSAGPIRSATRLYQANFLPGSLNLAKSFQDVIAASGGTRYGGQEDSFYRGNAGVLDPTGSGRITVGSLAARLIAQLRIQVVNDAINQAYALRPSEPPPAIAAPWGLGQTAVDASPPEDPIFGNDYQSNGTYCGSGGCGLVTTGPISLVNKTPAWVFWAFGLSAAVIVGAAAYGYYGPKLFQPKLSHNPINPYDKCSYCITKRKQRAGCIS
jgi:hypothetical protein